VEAIITMFDNKLPILVKRSIRGARTVKNLTTKLNFKIIGVVLLFLITVTAHNQWLSLQEENAENVHWLMSITNYLIKKKPPGSFLDIATKQGTANKSVREQVLAINQELQPIINDIIVPTDIIKFGYYSRQHESIVAIGSHTDISLLVGVDPNKFRQSYEFNTEQLIEKKNSILWHGANEVIYVRPIWEDGIVIGHAFASINQDAVYAVIWKRTVNTLLAAFSMLLVCIIVFRELFMQLKKDLQLFAEKILVGQTYDFNSEVTEFTPILQYISEQTEKMTRLDRLNIIGEMAAGIAHEVRNPMTTVRGLLQFMGTKQEFINHKEKFTLMIDELDRANSIITEFLSLAKNKAMNFAESNLNDLIRDLQPLLQADALRNNCDVGMSLGDIPTVFMDQNSIRQLILNMIRNGIDAMPTGGPIYITTEKDGQRVLLCIKDQGIGIPPENKEKLGTPFFTTKDNGTGLGLAVCYRIVQRHAATITMESELGKGTIFTIGFHSTISETVSSSEGIQKQLL
jgi:signal transduction histidine kinase